MKRSELKDKGNSIVDSIRAEIRKSPEKSVIAALGLGVVFAVFPGVVIPLIFIVAAIYAAVWFVSDEDEEIEEAEMTVNGNASESEQEEIRH